MPAALASNFVRRVPNKLPQQVAPPSKVVNLGAVHVVKKFCLFPDTVSGFQKPLK